MDPNTNRNEQSRLLLGLEDQTFVSQSSEVPPLSSADPVPSDFLAPFFQNGTSSSFNGTASSGDMIFDGAHPHDELGSAASSRAESLMSFTSNDSNPSSLSIIGRQVVSSLPLRPRIISPAPADAEDDDRDEHMPIQEVETTASGLTPSSILSSPTPSRVESSTRTAVSETQFLDAMGDATMVLHERYNREHKIQSVKNNFVLWSEGPLNRLEWSAVFVCPRSGEAFVAGSLRRNPPERHSHGGEFCFYSTKALARKAAAGRAEDCFKLRTPPEQDSWIVVYSKDDPYLRARVVPTDIPMTVRIQVRALQEQAPVAE